jgi:iron complex outermembrane receptor protein
MASGNKAEKPRQHEGSPDDRLAATASTLALSAPAFAQDAESSEDIIVTAQRLNQTEVSRGGSLGALGDKAAEDVPFSIKSYNAALILNQQPQSLGQVLENDPSVRTTYGFGNASEVFVIRGFTLNGDDVGLDGLYGIAPRQLIAPELYDSVQVINGSSAFLNGAAPGGSGLGGSVNLIPKRAGEKPLMRVTANYTSSEHFGGSFDFGRRFGANNEWGLRVNGVGRSGDVSIDNEFRSTYTLGAALDYNSGPLRLSLDLAYQRVRVDQLRHKITVGTATIPAVPRADANYAQPWNYTKLRDLFGIVKLEYDVADNALFYASFGARDGSEDGIYGGVTVLNAVTGAANGNALYVPRTDNNEAAQAGMRVKLAAGGITHEFNVGGSINWQVNRNAYDFLYGPGFAGFATNIYNTPVRPIPASALVGGNLADPFPVARNRLWSVFASDTIGLWDDRIFVTAGLRLQTISQKTYSYFGGAQNPGAYDDSAVTPVLGVVIKPVPFLSLFFNRMEGFEAPAAAPAAAGGRPVTNVGQAFAPTKSKQYEAGAKLTVFGKMNASLALFQIDRPTPGAIASTTVPGSVTYGLFSKQRNRGIEFSIDGELAEGLRVIAGGSVLDAKYKVSDIGLAGNKFPGVPEYLLNANVEWDLPFAPGFTLTGRAVHTGKQAANSANTLELPSWTRVDLGARFVTLVGDSPLTLRFNVDNVANKRYWASAFEIFSPDLLQGAPRTFKASASIDF